MRGVRRVAFCPTTYGIVGGGERRPTPSTLTASVGSLASELSFYSNGWLTVMAPRGWHCTGLVAVDGSLGLTVLPPYVSSETSSAAGTTAGLIGGIGPAAYPACRFFPEARNIDVYDCPPSMEQLPVRELVDRLSAHSVAFDDPAGVAGTGSPSGGPYPANGVLVFTGANTHDPTERWETCTLPASQHALCTAILNDYLAR